MTRGRLNFAGAWCRGAGGPAAVERRRPAPSCGSTSPAARSSRCRSRSRLLPAAATKPGRQNYPGRLGRSRALRPVPAARSAQLHPERRGGRRQPRFGDWRQINAQALVTGSVQDQADGRLRVEFRLWDVFAEQQLTGFGYTTTRQNWRRIAHIIADEIYKRITGEDGYFDTRIVYVAESGPALNAHQAPCDHGPGRRQQPLPDRRAGAGADPALFADRAGDHLPVLRQRRAAGLSAQHRHRAAGGDRRFPRHDLCAALFARRQPGRPEPRRERGQQHLRLRPAHPPADAADQHARRSTPRPAIRPTAARSCSTPTAAARSSFM